MNIFPYREYRQRLLAVALVALAVFDSGATWAADGRVHGKVQYEKILYRNPETGVPGLCLDRPVLRPVVGARIELIDNEGVVLASGRTDATGRYSLTWSATSQPTALVRVFADADNAVVVDHFEPERVYAVNSEAWPLPAGEASKDVTAGDGTRASGPFNILAVIRIGNDLIRAAEPTVVFPRLTIRWTSRPREGSSFFVRGKSEAYILGDRAKDSDEFDDFIILHEYGHYLAHTFSKDDSPGGPHGGGHRLDPRLAWSEGWATFFAAAALNDARYVDTGANPLTGSGALVEIDLNAERRDGDRAGYWSEFTVSSVLWAIHDTNADKGHLGAGFVEIWKTLRSKAWSDLPRYRNLVDFVDLLVKDKPEMGSRVAKVLAARGVKYSPAATPSVAEPYVRPIASGTPLEGEIDSLGELALSKLEARAVFSFTLTERKKVKIHMEITDSRVKDKADLDLWLFDAAGKALRFSNASNGVGDTETIEAELAPGRYFVEVQSWAALRNGGILFNTGRFRLRVDF
ncbi:MAG: pre-peptidase C-terminal domain-containing protein [Gemmataceae bacterium]